MLEVRRSLAKPCTWQFFTPVFVGTAAELVEVVLAIVLTGWGNVGRGIVVIVGRDSIDVYLRFKVVLDVVMLRLLVISVFWERPCRGD
jgi:hypothetical protein